MADARPLPSLDEILAAPWRCPRCRAALPRLTKICPGCRTPFRLPQEAWFQDRATMLAMLFLVAGPLAIPWLWNSARFRTAEKGALTTGVIAWTALLFAAVAWLLVSAYAKITSVVK